MKNFYYHLSLLKSRSSAYFSSEKYLHSERFSYPHECRAFSTDTPDDYGILLGIDEFGRHLQIATNKEAEAIRKCIRRYTHTRREKHEI